MSTQPPSTAAPSTQDEGTRKIAALTAKMDFAMLTTVDAEGGFVSRPMARQDADFDGNLWFVSSRKSRKVEHIEANPHVGVVLSARDAWVSVNGTAEVVEDRAKANELWTPQMTAWFPQGPDHESVVVIKVTGESAEYWENAGGLVSSALSFVKVKTTGERASNGDNETVDLRPGR